MRAFALRRTGTPGPAEVLDKQMQDDSTMSTKLINELGIEPEN